MTSQHLKVEHSMVVSKQQGQVFVALLWIIIPFLGSFVYFFADIGLKFTDCLFESYSGFTTTGSSIIDKPETLPKWLLVYRSFTQWIGGLGFALLIIAILRKKSLNLNNLFNAEFFSLTNNKIFPHLHDTVDTIFVVYFTITVACLAALYFQGMSWVDSLCYAFSTISTGGFVTNSGNIGAYSPSIQWTIICFMFLSGISFFLFVRFFKGKFRSVFSNEQLRYYTIIILFVSLCFVLYWSLSSDMGLVDKIRSSIFYSVSIVSSTGYDLRLSSPGEFVMCCLLLLMFIGGCSASSSTGLKIIRVILLFRFARTALTRIFHPHAVVPVMYNKKAVEDQEIERVFGFFFLYLLTFLIGVFVLCCLNNDFSLSIYLSAANLGNIGPIVGNYTAQFAYSGLNTASQMFLILLMLMGRLEIYSFLVIFLKGLRKK
jgi:trk system potassium uptake protein